MRKAIQTMEAQKLDDDAQEADALRTNLRLNGEK